MRSFDMTPLLRSSVGFENLNRLVDFATRPDLAGDAYPPYNIEKTGDDEYRVTMAVAGFAQDDLDISVKENVLTIKAKAGEDDSERTFLHRGIAKRSFERRFHLADTIRVTGASFENGLLNVELVREVPEHKKERRIEINTVAAQPTIEQAA
ncbi:MAG: Hsp20 family protein [Sphingomonadales bacterium]